LLFNGVPSQSTILSLPSEPKGDFRIHYVQEALSLFIGGFSVLFARYQVWCSLIITRGFNLNLSFQIGELVRLSFNSLVAKYLQAHTFSDWE